MREQIQRLFEAIRRGRRFAAHDIWHIGRPGEDVPSGFIIKQIRVAILLVSNLWRGTVMLRASALTFATILAIVPSLAIMFYLIQTFELDEAIFLAAKDRVETVVEGAADFLRPDEILEEGAGETAPADADAEGVDADAAAPVDETVSVEAPPPEGDPDGEDGVPIPEDPGIVVSNVSEADQTLRDLVRQMLFPETAETGGDFVDPVQELFDMASTLADKAAADPGALFVAGLVLFFTTVLGLMRNIENSFNHIWGVRRTRPWFRMIGDYMLITMLLPFVATAVLGVTAALQTQTVQDALGPLAALVHGSQFAVICFMFSALYFIVPNTRVRPGYALLGGLVAGTIWVFLSWAYVHFQFGLTRYNVAYSTFAQFPMLLMWIYLSWTILLFGAEFTFACQNEKTFAMERFAEDASYAYREALAIRAMADVAQRFDEGRPGLEPGAAATELNVPTRLLNDILDDLAEAGIVTACATEPVSYLPAKALSKLTVAEVIHAMREVGRDPSLLRDDEHVRKILGAAQKDGVESGSITLAELISEFPEPSSPPESETIPFRSEKKSAEDAGSPRSS